MGNVPKSRVRIVEVAPRTMHLRDSTEACSHKRYEERTPWAWSRGVGEFLPIFPVNPGQISHSRTGQEQCENILVRDVFVSNVTDQSRDSDPYHVVLYHHASPLSAFVAAHTTHFDLLTTSFRASFPSYLLSFTVILFRLSLQSACYFYS